MTHQAKAPAAGSTQASGSSCGLLRRALATRAASFGSRGSGAPASRRARATLAVLVLAIAVFALTAAPALAAPQATIPVPSNPSYASVHVEAQFNVDGYGEGIVEYSTDQNDWKVGFSEADFSFVPGLKPIKGEIKGLKGATTYIVRVHAVGFFGGEAFSSAPNPSFTTLAADAPTIPGTVAASSVFSTSATATGKVVRPTKSDDLKCRFEYVTDADFKATGFAGATVRDCAQSPIGAADAETEKDVSAQLGCTNPLLEEPEGKCLEPGTTYHLRLAAENASPTVVTKDAASTFTTAPKVAAPTVIAADDASEVTKRSAQASGEVERPAGADPALDTSCRFEFVTDADFIANGGFAGAGQAPCVENPITSPAPGYPAVSTGVTAELPGLTPGTTYHLRLVAENGGGADAKEAAGTFTTVAIIPPMLSLDSITEVGYTSFRVTGTVDPGNQGIAPWFEFALAGTEEWRGGYIGTLPEVSSGSPAKQVSNHFPCFFESICISPLKPGTTYQVRFAGNNRETYAYEYSPQPYEEFTTLGTSTSPSATLDITNVTAASVHFSGTVDTHAPAGSLPDEAKVAYKTSWHIECVPECKDANGNVLAGTVEAEEGSKAFAVDSKHLEPGTEYNEVKLIASNALGTVETPVQSFKTVAIPPTVKTSLGGSDGKGGYTLQGVVNPNKHTITACEFKWGPNAPAYAFSAPCSQLPSGGTKPVTVEAQLSGLNTGVDYHALLIVTYDAGAKAQGVDQKFVVTLDPPEVCPNAQLRKENNSLALPECRAYEMVTPPGKEGFGASFETARRQRWRRRGLLYRSKPGISPNLDRTSS